MRATLTHPPGAAVARSPRWRATVAERGMAIPLESRSELEGSTRIEMIDSPGFDVVPICYGLSASGACGSDRHPPGPRPACKMPTRGAAVAGGARSRRRFSRRDRARPEPFRRGCRQEISIQTGSLPPYPPLLQGNHEIDAARF
jgi:hypothetical protein